MMECKACGYKKGHELDENGGYKEINPKGEDFVKINGYFTVDRHGYTHQIYIVACPECGTVKMDY